MQPQSEPTSGKLGQPRSNRRTTGPFESQALMLSLRALAPVIYTTLSLSFLICSPVEGLRTMRSGRSRQ